VRSLCARAWSKVTGQLLPSALSTRAIGLTKALVAEEADVYIAHNIDTLLPAGRAASRRGALLMFDSMEFHSDMGDGQSQWERQLVRELERKYLPKCCLIFSSSDQIADALVEEYGVARPLPLYNVPPKEEVLLEKPRSGLALYWRNAVIGLGQRGLDDALVALTKLPSDVSLHLQGRLPSDGGSGLRLRIAELEIQSRVVCHQPYSPENAVKEASRYHIGLCLERAGIRNHELTVSNKMFDYHMARLAVISSDLPPLRSILEQSKAGLLFVPGSPDDLAAKIALLYNDREALRSYAVNARHFAMNQANREIEMKKFSTALADAVKGGKAQGIVCDR
jgi:glycosyltransferase involved in cell wall biosynthesis